MKDYLYRYRCKVNRVIDGDTIDVDIDLGFDCWLHDERVRIDGIDCPETRTRDLVEKQFGFITKRRVEELLPVGEFTYLISSAYFRRGGFGRVIGDFLVNDTWLSEILIKEHHAIYWLENDRDQMEANHLRNRTYLLDGDYLTEEDKYRIQDLMTA